MEMKNLAKKLVAIQQDIQPVLKDENNPFRMIDNTFFYENDQH